MAIRFEYCFKFEDGSEKAFALELDDKTFLLQLPTGDPPPDWAKLDHRKCSHCPYSSGEHPYCPVAKNLAQAAHAFKDEKSFRKATVFVKGADRFYGRQTDLQTGLQAMFGLIMATSDCPHMAFFRPLAKHYLPFSNMEESKLRLLGSYLIQQFEKNQKGQPADFAADGLNKIVANVHILNAGIIERVRSVSKGDADWNAITLLDAFASLLAMDTAKR